MIKHEVTYHDNYQIKSYKEYNNDKLVVREEFDYQGNLLYKETIYTLRIIEYLPDGKTSIFIEDKYENTWKRYLSDNNGNELLTERSNGTWYESRYNEKGKINFFLNCYGSIHYHDTRGNTKYEQFDEPELLCSYELNFEKSENKFGGFED